MYRRNGRGRLVLLVFLALSVVIITLDFRGGSDGPLSRVKDFAQAIVSPVQRGITTVTRPVGDFFSAVGDLTDLREENRRLEAELQALEAEAARARGLTEENVDLKEILEIEEPWFNMDKVAAQVTSAAPGNYKWAVFIDKGSTDGIKEDMAVITPEGLVGKIVQTSAGQSTVLLMIDPNAGATATTEEGSVTGSLTGNGEGEDLSLDLVDKDATIEVGNRVITSNFNRGIFPRGIPIGLVSHKGGDTRASQLEIDVAPAVDFSDLNVVLVLLETGPNLEVKGRAVASP
ncbi:MAG: rod shape-determining protein MreC [Actinomycetota bacterium]